MRKFKETKKQFDRVREDMEIAQVKNAQAPKNKPHEVEEATTALTVSRKCFRHLALDYVLQVQTAQTALLDHYCHSSSRQAQGVQVLHQSQQQRFCVQVLNLSISTTEVTISPL